VLSVFGTEPLLESLKPTPVVSAFVLENGFLGDADQKCSAGTRQPSNDVMPSTDAVPYPEKAHFGGFLSDSSCEMVAVT
jgi:hypothetical protein